MIPVSMLQSLLKVERLDDPNRSHTSSPQPLSVRDDMSTSPKMFNSVPERKKGYILKQGHYRKNWKNRYFVLDNGELIYYESSTSNFPFGVKQLGDFDLHEAEVCECKSILTLTGGDGRTKLNLEIKYPNEREDDPQKRPNALHLSILFNSYDAMQCLMDHNCDKTMSVWFGDVAILEIDNKLVDSTPPPGGVVSSPLKPTTPSKNKYSTTSSEPGSGMNANHTYSTLEFIHAVFHRNVHRITDGMQAKKILNWKSVCASHNKRLTFLFNTTKISARLNAKELNTRQSFAVDAETEEGRAAASLAAIAAGVASNMTLSDVDATRDARSDSMDSNYDGMSSPVSNNEGNLENKDVVTLPAVSKGSSSVPKQGGAGSLLNTALTNAHNANTPVLTKGVSISASADDPVTLPQEDNPKVKTVKNKPHFLQPRPKRYNWREHAMIKKITRPAIVITESIPVTETAPGVFVVGQSSAQQNNASGRQLGQLGSNSRDRADSTGKSMGLGSNSGDDRSKSGTPLPNIKPQSTPNGRPNSRSGVTATNGWAGTNTTYKIKETTLLGKKSFWLESRAAYAADKAHREAPEYGSDYEEVQGEDEVVETTHKEMSRLDPNGNWMDSQKVHHDYKLGRTDFVDNIKNHRVSMVDLEHATDREKIAYYVHQKHENEEMKREGVDVLSLSVPPTREALGHGGFSQVLDFSDRLSSNSNDSISMSSNSNMSTPMQSSRGIMLKDLSVKDLSMKDLSVSNMTSVSVNDTPVIDAAPAPAPVEIAPRVVSPITSPVLSRPGTGEFVKPSLTRLGSSSRRNLLVRAISVRRDLRAEEELNEA
eukprot:gene22417-28542_t